MPREEPTKPSGRNKNRQTNLRLTEVAREAMEALAARRGISSTALVEQMIREAAREEGVRVKGLGK